jgi:hypothetical protein
MAFVARVAGVIAGVVLLVASMTAGLQRLGVLDRPGSVRVALAAWRPGCIPPEQVPAGGDEEARLLRLRLAGSVPVERRPGPSTRMVAASVCVAADGRVRDVVPDESALRTDELLIFAGKVRAWRLRPGPARCYRDRFAVTAARRGSAATR